MEMAHLEKIQNVVLHINEILNIVDLFEPSRPGSMVITKCEEAVHWCQTMMSNVPLRKELVNPVDENISEINTPE
jgi:hypothetical protein